MHILAWVSELGFMKPLNLGQALDYGIQISMDGKGRATDNIAIERFWRSAKYENIYLNEYNTTAELKAGITEYIRFYNDERFHQTLNYEKPMEVYNGVCQHRCRLKCF